MSFLEGDSPVAVEWGSQQSDINEEKNKLVDICMPRYRDDTNIENRKSGMTEYKSPNTPRYSRNT